WNGSDRHPAVVWTGGAALAASMFIRPNFAIAVVWVGAAYAWVSWRRGDRRSIVALALGLGMALWMPFHNWFYGHAFYLISRSSSSVSMPLGPGDYAAALRDVLLGRLHTHGVGV